MGSKVKVTDDIFRKYTFPTDACRITDRRFAIEDHLVNNKTARRCAWLCVGDRYKSTRLLSLMAFIPSALSIGLRVT